MNDLEEYEKAQGLVEIDPQQQPLPDEYSGVSRPLQLAYDSLHRHCGTKAARAETVDPDLNTLPFEQLQTIVSNQASQVQKRTAVKVLQRHFRNVKSADFNDGVNFDEGLEHARRALESQVKHMKEDIEEQLEKIERQATLIEE